jgi:hypothetical protein
MARSGRDAWSLAVGPIHRKFTQTHVTDSVVVRTITSAHQRLGRLTTRRMAAIDGAPGACLKYYYHNNELLLL